MIKLLLSLSLLVAGFSVASANPAFMPVGDTVYNFGAADEGAVIEHVFKFKNAGQDTLKISGVKGSCGCTKATASAAAIAPDQTGEIKVSYNSKGQKDFQQKTVTVSTNDPGHARFVYRLSGTLKAPQKGASRQ